MKSTPNSPSNSNALSAFPSSLGPFRRANFAPCPGGGAIAAVLKKLRRQRSLAIQPVGDDAFFVAWDPGKVRIDVATRRKVSRHNHRSAEKTDSTVNARSVVRSLSREAIDIRHFLVKMTVANEIIPAPVIGKVKKDIGPIRFTCRASGQHQRGKCGHKKNDEYSHWLGAEIGLKVEPGNGVDRELID